MDIQILEEKSKSIRRTALTMIYQSKTTHLGCAFSCVDILVALYFAVLRIDPRNPLAEDRDRMILSKGHAVAALYATLAERGFFPKERLEEYCKDGSRLASHVVRGAVPGAETSSGSGGHGLSLGVGMALALRNKKSPARVFVLSGDGELEEGSVWEAALFAGFHKLSNLKIVIDYNHFQDGTDGLRVDDILNLQPLDAKWRSFGWEVDVINGHNFEELISVLGKNTTGPHAIIANTIKGKGVSFMENRGEWHGKCPSQEEYERAMKELF